VEKCSNHQVYNHHYIAKEIALSDIYQGQLVEELRYKPEGRGFDSRWDHWNFSWLKLSSRTMALVSSQPLTEMSTRNISWRVKTAGA
jgi:hypothetical protein